MAENNNNNNNNINNSINSISDTNDVSNSNSNSNSNSSSNGKGKRGGGYISLEKIIITALLIALAVVLSKLLSINLAFLRIGFGFIPIAVLAILFGPIWAGVASAIADVLGAIIFPTGAFFPGFTVSAFLTGLIFGLFLYKKEITWARSFISCALVCLLVNLLLNTYWLTFFISSEYTVLLASRAIKELVAIPIMAVIIKLSNEAIKKAYTERK